MDSDEKIKTSRGMCKHNGWGKRIRTFGMSESESDALPLGDTPIYLESQRTYYIIIDAQE